MKNLKIILSVAVIAALMTMTFASCGDPEPDPDKSWTVTFDANGGTTVASATVADQGTVSLPNSFKAWTPTVAGFYSASQVATWKNGTKAWNFDTDKVTADITLKADWANPSNISLNGLTPNNGSNLEKIASYINTKQDKFIWAVSTAETSGPVALSAKYADLTIIGVGASDTTITLSSNGSLITVGPPGTENVIADSTIALTVKSKVNLVGKDGNNKAVIFVKDGATFTLDGGKITGNSNDGSVWSSSTNNSGFGVAGIHVDGATFEFKSGEISGNTNLKTANSNQSYTQKNGAGAVYVEAGGTVNLLGGTFSGNVNGSGAGPKDVYATYSSLVKLGGTSFNGEITLGYRDRDATKNKNTILVDPTFNNTTTTLSLSGDKNSWLNQVVLQGATTTQQGKIVFGKLYTTTNVDITSNLKWDTSVVGKLVSN